MYAKFYFITIILLDDTSYHILHFHMQMKNEFRNITFLVLINKNSAIVSL